MKRIISVALISLFLSLAIRWDCLQGSSLSSNQVILTAFKVSDIKVLSSSISSWGRLKTSNSMDEMIQTAKHYAAYFLEDITQTENNYSDSLREVSIKGVDREGNIILVCIETEGMKNGEIQNNLKIDITHDGEYNVDCIKEKLQKFSKIENIQMHRKIQMVGIIDGQIQKAESYLKNLKINLKNPAITQRYNYKENRTYMIIESEN